VLESLYSPEFSQPNWRLERRHAIDTITQKNRVVNGLLIRLAGTREPIRLPFQLVGVKSFYGIFLTGVHRQ
jgi:hypothetical protein